MIRGTGVRFVVLGIDLLFVYLPLDGQVDYLNNIVKRTIFILIYESSY